MVQVSIKADFRDVQRKLNALSAELQRKVVPAALNKVGAKANTEMVRQITHEYRIQQSEVRRKLKLRRAERKLANWFATLEPVSTARRGGSLNLIRFVEKSVSLAEAKRRKRGGTANQLRFQIKRTGGRQSITGAFIANQGRTVFVRIGDKRLPIKAASTIGVAQMFNTRRNQSAVLARIERELPVEFDRAIRAAVAGVFR